VSDTFSVDCAVWFAVLSFSPAVAATPLGDNKETLGSVKETVLPVETSAILSDSISRAESVVEKAEPRLSQKQDEGGMVSRKQRLEELAAVRHTLRYKM
jgi:hypothetical protein